MYTILALVLLLVPGCATLSVQVDVLSPEHVDTAQEQAELRRQYSQVMLGGDDGLVASVDATREQFNQFFVNLAASYRRDASTFPTGGAERVGLDMLARDLTDALDPTTDIGRAYDQQFRAFQEQMHAANARVRAEAAGRPPRMNEPITGALAETLRQRLARQRAFEAFIIAETRPIVEQARATSREAGISADVDRAAILRSITGGQTLENSAFAYAVAAAPESAWANRYNRAFGTGVFGNVDLAIKLQNLGDFTVKGMNFDPRKVAEVAAKVGTQSVLLAAQIAGVPVSLPAGTVPAGSSGGALADSSRDLAALEAKEAVRDVQRRDRDRALVDIAAAISAERQALQSSVQATRERARDAISESFAANKARLDLSGLQ